MAALPPNIGRESPVTVFNTYLDKLDSPQKSAFMHKNCEAILQLTGQNPATAGLPDQENRTFAQEVDAVVTALNKFSREHNTRDARRLQERIKAIFADSNPAPAPPQRPPAAAPPAPSLPVIAGPPLALPRPNRAPLQRMQRQIFSAQPTVTPPTVSSDATLLGRRVPASEAAALIASADKTLNENSMVLVEQPANTFTYAQVILSEGDKVVCALDEQRIISVPRKLVHKLLSQPSAASALRQSSTEPPVELTREEIGGTANRSARMVNFLARFSNFQKGALYINSKPYTPLTGNVTDISKHLLASCGSSPDREIAILDPSHSPLLDQHYHALLHHIEQLRSAVGGRPLSDKEVINAVTRYMRSAVFPPEVPVEKQVDDFVRQQLDNKAIAKMAYSEEDQSTMVPIIPIDMFIAQKIGVCRHHAMVTAYFLDRLTKEPQPCIRGVAQHMRDNVDDGGHVWVTFMSANGGRWHIDTLWNAVGDFSKPDIESQLKKLYGAPAVENMQRRTARAHTLATGVVRA